MVVVLFGMFTLLVLHQEQQKFHHLLHPLQLRTHVVERVLGLHLEYFLFRIKNLFELGEKFSEYDGVHVDTQIEIVDEFHYDGGYARTTLNG